MVRQGYVWQSNISYVFMRTYSNINACTLCTPRAEYTHEAVKANTNIYLYILYNVSRGRCRNMSVCVCVCSLQVIYPCRPKRYHPKSFRILRSQTYILSQAMDCICAYGYNNVYMRSEDIFLLQGKAIVKVIKKIAYVFDRSYICHVGKTKPLKCCLTGTFRQFINFEKYGLVVMMLRNAHNFSSSYSVYL